MKRRILGTRTLLASLAAVTMLYAGCASPGPSGAPGHAYAPAATRADVASCSGPGATVSPGPAPVVPTGLRVPHGFQIETIAGVQGVRDLAALPDGDLIAATTGSTVYIVPNAESAGAAGTPRLFATISDDWAAGVLFVPALCEVYFASEHGIFATPYHSGDLQAENVTQIAAVRVCKTGSCARDHVTTTLAYTNGVLYASVGSDCNACTETDPFRAAILQMTPQGSGITKRATRIRNAIALAVNPSTGSLWAGGAGQDSLPFGHPYEFLDDVSSHPGVADYGWPECEENHHAYVPGANCTNTVAPLLELPAYSTIESAVFYPLAPTGPYSFPAAYRGALFANAHGSWHTIPNAPAYYAAMPQVVAFPMKGDLPLTPVDWTNPRSAPQWKQFVEGFQPGGNTRIGRPTGIAVGPKGSLFVADADANAIYRIRYVP